MRIRSTKPEFWRSKTIAQLDWDVRFVLKGLEAYVDDNGVGKNDIALIASDVFPRDLSARTSETLARLLEAISKLSDAGLIVLYEIDGEDLLYIDKWKNIQRVDKPRPGRFPRPDGTIEYSEPVDRDSYRKPRGTFATVSETLAPVTGEQGNRGTGEPPYPPDDEPPPEEPPLSRNDGRGKALAKFNREANATARSPKAHSIAKAFSDSLPVPIESGVLAEIGAAIDRCLRDDIPPPAIANGIQDWARSDSWSPTQIPRFVAKAAAKAAKPNGNHAGKPTEKALGYDAAADQLLAELGVPQ